MNIGNFLIPVKDFMSLDPFRLFPNRMERLLEEPMLRPWWDMKSGRSRPGFRRATSSRPTQELVMKFELPEVKKEDVEVKVEQNVLTLRGERKFEEKDGPRKLSSRRAALW